MDGTMHTEQHSKQKVDLNSCSQTTHSVTLSKEMLGVKLHNYKVYSPSVVSSRNYSVKMSYWTICQTDIFITL